MTEIITQTVVVSLDALTRYCGFFSSESIINNYYNCDHDNPPDSENDDELGKEIGCCFPFECPVASSLYEDDGYAESENMMSVYDPAVIKRIIDAAKIHEEKYGKIEGYCTVNGITLTHLSRYRYGQMRFCMDEREKRMIEEHLNNCSPCREKISVYVNKSQARLQDSSSKVTEP